MQSTIGHVLLYGLSGLAVLFLVRFSDLPVTSAPLGPPAPKKKSKLQYVFSTEADKCYTPFCPDCPGGYKVGAAVASAQFCLDYGGAWLPGKNGQANACVFNGDKVRYPCYKLSWVDDKIAKNH